MVLIEQESAFDVQSALFMQWMERLQAHGVRSQRFTFSREPQLLVAHDLQQKYWTLQDLHAAFPRHRVLVLSTAHHFVSPISGRARPWLQDLHRWEHRLLVVPSAMRPEPLLSQRLAEHELQFIDTHDLGLEGPPGHDAGLQENPDPTLPHDLAHDAHYWLQRRSPPTEEVRQLCQRLRHFLDEDGYLLLAACALHPMIRMGVMVEFSDHLLPHAKATRSHCSSLYLRLSSLPWFRAAYMPKWLRAAILSTIDRTQTRDIHAATQRLLLPTKQANLCLQIGKEAPELLARIWRLKRRSARWRH